MHVGLGIQGLVDKGGGHFTQRSQQIYKVNINNIISLLISGNFFFHFDEEYQSNFWRICWCKLIAIVRGLIQWEGTHG